MTSTKRNILIDIARGTAIFLMLWGHCIQFCLAGSSIDYYKITVYQIIYSFHMPLFMLISGYLFFFSFSKRSKKELLVYRTQSLIQPIVAGAVFSYLVTSVFFNALSGNFSLLFDGSWLYTLPSLWFLWSVLAASLAVILVCKSFDSIAVQAVLLLVMVLIPAVCQTETSTYMCILILSLVFILENIRTQFLPIYTSSDIFSWFYIL